MLGPNQSQVLTILLQCLPDMPCLLAFLIAYSTLSGGCRPLAAFLLLSIQQDYTRCLLNLAALNLEAWTSSSASLEHECTRKDIRCDCQAQGPADCCNHNCSIVGMALDGKLAMHRILRARLSMLTTCQRMTCYSKMMLNGTCC